MVVTSIFIALVVNMCFLIQDRGWRLNSSAVYFSHVRSSYLNEISCLS